MPRHMRLTSEASFRAVILRRIPGLHNKPLQTYTMADGATIDYHTATAYGPYATEAAAKGQLTTAKSHGGSEWINGQYVQVDMDAFVETSNTNWTRVP